jgi:hypothetical protein
MSFIARQVRLYLRHLIHQAVYSFVQKMVLIVLFQSRASSCPLRGALQHTIQTRAPKDSGSLIRIRWGVGVDAIPMILP